MLREKERKKERRSESVRVFCVHKFIVKSMTNEVRIRISFFSSSLSPMATTVGSFFHSPVELSLQFDHDDGGW
jgi:hypothetical protein